MTKRIPGTAVSRRAVFAGAAGTAALIAAPAILRAQQARRFIRPIVAGLNAKAGDPTYELIARISKIMKEKHNVEMDIQVHPSSVLGTDLSQLEAVQTGFIDITSNATLQFSTFSDAFVFVDLPYSISSWDQGLKLFKSDLWKEQAAKYEAKVPMKVLPPVGGGGFRLLWNNKRPIKSPDDAKGLKFRTTNSTVEIELFRKWGSNPTPLAWTETYNALSSGVVEGMHVQPIWTYNFKMHEVLKHATEIDAIFAVQFQVMNMNTWKSMPKPIQDAFWAAAQEAADQANAMDRAAEGDFKKKLAAAKMEIYTPTAAEKEKWTASGRDIWATAGKNVDRAVLDRLVKL